MGSYTFKWEHPASEVYVTGTFDNWSKSVLLEKKGDVFEKTVELPLGQRVLYKFVVDGNWVTDHTAPKDTDEHNNTNNILLPENIIEHEPPSNHSIPGAAIMSTVTPNSTTAELAKNVPLEKRQDATITSAAPESSTAALAKDVPLENKGISSALPGAFPETPQAEPIGFSVNPIPATDGPGNPIHLAPGEKVPDPNTLTHNTVGSTVHDDLSLKKKDEDSQDTFSVKPLPATAGPGNPIHLKPGEPVPDASTLTGNTIQSTVTTDKESYEKGAGLSGVPMLPPVVTPQDERDAKGTGVLDLPPISNNMIPESSLPIGEDGSAASTEKDPGVTISSAAPSSTTAALAAAVPLEPKGAGSEVPEVVKESQAEAHAPAEASASAEAVKEKAAVEEELKSEVPVEPPTSEGTGQAGTIAGAAAGVTALAGGALAAGWNSAKQMVGGAATSKDSTAGTTLTAKETVSDAAVTTKDAAVAATTNVKETVSNATGLGKDIPAETAEEVPEVVKESIAEAHVSPEATTNPEAVHEKAAVENELLHEVKREEGSGEPAPSPAAADNLPAKVAEPEDPSTASRDVSPMSKPATATQTAPVVTTGIAERATDKVTEAPKTPSGNGVKSDTPGSSKTDTPATTEKKKKNRLSFFGKIKAKLHSDKDKK